MSGRTVFNRESGPSPALFVVAFLLLMGFLVFHYRGAVLVTILWTVAGCAIAVCIWSLMVIGRHISEKHTAARRLSPRSKPLVVRPTAVERPPQVAEGAALARDLAAIDKGADALADSSVTLVAMPDGNVVPMKPVAEDDHDDAA